MGTAKQYDAAVIGGGIAGLQAALTLARSRRRVLLCDAGKPRHRFAARMHNFIGADGLSPEDFYARAHAELAQYPHVTRLPVTVTQAQRAGDMFQVHDDHQATHEARKLLFASGVRDMLPDIDGLEALWGKQVQHCSYCHGYEVRDGNIAVLTSGDDAWANALSLAHLSRQLQFFFADALPDDALIDRLQAQGFRVAFSRLRSVAPAASGLILTMADGQTAQSDVLFVKPDHALNSALPFALGCREQEGFVEVNGWGQTSVPGVYAAGDMAGGTQQLVAAAGSGLYAAMMLHTELAREDLR